MNRYYESESVELKAGYTDTVVREIVSFLNTEGGVIYIGIEDDGTVIGIENVEGVLRQVSDCITDQIEPKPIGEVISAVILEDNLPIVVVNVKKGIKPIYCIKKYGFSSKGCPVRIGNTCKEMSPEEIQYRYKSLFVDQDYMLLASAKYAPLSFEMMKILLTGRGYHINESSFESSFKLRRNDGTYNLLAEVLADKNMVPLIFVKFSGPDKTSISHRSDYGGQSILLGYQKMKDRLIAENICKTDTSVRPRIDEYLYDIDCVNEALVNMLVHNDWTVTEPLVSFYSDRVVFTSHGGIPQGITEEEFYNGVSQPRNALLMRIFLNMGIVEHTGHGVPMIVKRYGREVFDIHKGYIDVTIPFNKNVLASVPNSVINESAVGYGVKVYKDLTDTEKEAILVLVEKPDITYDKLALEINVSRRTVARTIASLTEKKYIERVGNNKVGFWKVIR
ncbi:MAG TPA: putative DNA binding domain-containing protein [Clostridia bacterium]|jgi:predicted HTH transcriptional regulator|nr:putative DNA binding domain-containing protein [Clostridia bacterium]HOM34146.1 putative DNA binding domain-containing protein [Clostridia bacterium]HOR89811.1 putative DNA binding domain-containing protein [Clostridia bacterium]HOT71465.1 putative DNA binding domain-containing protein [Clostridia bacterium]HPL08157.1 putative DNA binding domain-containing protein [Clostridia bacterium]